MKTTLRMATVIVLAALMTAMVFLAAHAAAPAGAIEVNSTADDLTAGDAACTLREAIMNANADADTTGGDCAAGSGADTIMLPAGTYTLTIAGSNEDANATGDLDIVDDDGLIIQGAGAEMTIIDGNQLDRVLHIQGTLNADNNPDILNDLTVANGLSSGGTFQGGGGVFNQNALLTLNNCVVRNNSVQAVPNNFNGGGLLNVDGHVTLNQTVVRQNAVAPVYVNLGLGGGGVFSNAYAGDASLELIDSEVFSNTSSVAGGLGAIANFVHSHTLTLSNTTVSHNVALAGGGLYVWAASPTARSFVSMSSSTISANLAEYLIEGGAGIAGGAGFVRSEVFIEASAIVSNTASAPFEMSGVGGGLFFNNSPATVGNSTLTGNSAQGDPALPHSGAGGGLMFVAFATGLYENSGLNLINTTIANNYADASGGGLLLEGWATAYVTATLTNTLIAANSAVVDGSNCFVSVDTPNATFVSHGHNLEDDDTCNLNQPTDLVNTDPLLGPLQDNGGATWTHALLEGSPAVDAADDAACAAPPVNGVDQRGVARPQDGDGDGGASCDIGAFEVEGAAPTGARLYLPVVIRPQ